MYEREEDGLMSFLMSFCLMGFLGRYRVCGGQTNIEGNAKKNGRPLLILVLYFFAFEMVHKGQNEANDV